MNRNDVIKGLECCSQGIGGADEECSRCPYSDNGYDCSSRLMADALEYIKFYLEKMDDMLAELKDRLDVVRCCECIHSQPWYADKRICRLWDENGIDVFNDGYCNYGKRREEDG